MNHSRSLPLSQSTIVKLGRYEHLLFPVLVFASVFLPIAAQSITLGLFFILVVARYFATHQSIISPSPYVEQLQQYVLIAAALLGIAGLGFALSGSTDQTTGEVARHYARLIVKEYVIGLFLVFCVVGVRQQDYQPRRAYAWFGGFVVFTVLYMLGQRFWGWDWVHGLSATLPENRFAYGVYRANGWMGHPLTLGFNVMTFAVLMGCWGLGFGRPERWKLSRAACLSILGLCFVMLMLSQARWSILVLMLILVPAILVKWRKKLRWVIFAGVIIVGLFALDPGVRGRFSEVWTPGQPLEQKVERLIFWRVHTQMFLEHPWFGVGFNHSDSLLLDYYDRAGYTNIEHKYAAHNIYLQTLADTGIIGFLSFAVLILGCSHVAWRLWRQQRDPTLALLIGAALVGGITQNTFRDSEYLYCFWICVALVLATHSQHGATPQRDLGHATGTRSQEKQNLQSGKAPPHLQ